MLKAVLATAGFVAGGVAGTLAVAVLAGAAMPAPPNRMEPMAGLEPLWIGLVFGGATGAAGGYLAGSNLARRLRERAGADERLWAACILGAIAVVLSGWWFMESYGGW
jgi:hypothetical protein